MFTIERHQSRAQRYLVSYRMLTILEDSHFRSRCVLRRPRNGERYLRNDLAPIFLTQQQRLAKSSFHLFNRTNSRVLPRGRGYCAQSVYVESHISAIDNLFLIGQKASVRVLEQFFTIDGVACKAKPSLEVDCAGPTLTCNSERSRGRR